MIDNQFYPTPPQLALYAYNLFENKKILRLLEASAGRGDMIDVVHNTERGCRDKVPIDCVEIDFENQAILRDKGYRVVGHDFLNYNGGPAYSHILMNPPFSQGVRHVLHAWKLLNHGEIVAIINAETIRNPYTRERQYLARLIKTNGKIEYHQSAFLVGETQRKSEVEIAIVYLKKVSAFKENFLDGLKREVLNEKKPEQLFETPKEVMLGSRFIQNQVDAFNLAVAAEKFAQQERARANYYATMLGNSILDETTNTHSSESARYNGAKAFNDAYTELKERAWSSILRSSQVMDKLGSQAQKRLESDFQNVAALEFTKANIYGFLEGLIAQQWTLQVAMACDVFDVFGRYREGNMHHYCGWKSNTKHRLNAFKLKHTRVILPEGRYGWYRDGFSVSLAWDDAQRFRDFDKVFAMLDGKSVETIYGLSDLLESQVNLRKAANGERVSSDYFDVRFYPKAGTFHLYPRNKELIERLNRIVGRHRAWLPDENRSASDGFWEQYDQADSIAKHIDWKGIDYWKLEHGSVQQRTEMGAELTKRYKTALDAAGIEYDPESALEHYEGPGLPAPDISEAA